MPDFTKDATKILNNIIADAVDPSSLTLDSCSRYVSNFNRALYFFQKERLFLSFGMINEIQEEHDKKILSKMDAKTISALISIKYKDVLACSKELMSRFEKMSSSNSHDTRNAEQIIESIFSKFRDAANTLRRRKHKRPDFNIENEYDVQDLLHSFLKIFFEDVRPEEYTPSYAGGSNKMDFLLKNENIVIEAKMTRDSLRDRQIGDELIIDIDRYKGHPSCKLLYCFVFDPNNYISNKKGLMADLNGKSDEELQVKVFIES